MSLLAAVVAVWTAGLAACGDDDSGNENVNNNHNENTNETTLTITAPDADSVHGGQVTVEGTVDGEADEIVFRVDGETVESKAPAGGTVSFVWDTGALQDGGYTLTLVAAVDGGAVAHSDPVAVVVDNTAPALAVSNLERPYVYTESTEFTVTVDDAHPGDEVVLMVDATEADRLSSAPYTFTFDPSGRADGPVEIRIQTTDVAGNTAEHVLDGVVILEGQIVTYDDGDGEGVFFVPENYEPGMEVHHKVHWTMPADITSIMAVAQWDDPTWAFEVATGSGNCPHSGQLYSAVEAEGLQAVTIHDATDLSLQSYPTDTHFIHLGEASTMDLTERKGEGSNYWLIVAIY
jgi:hypothetical protein